MVPGKVGREHIRRWTIKPGLLTYNIEACSECHREFRYCFGPLQRGGRICGSCEKEGGKSSPIVRVQEGRREGQTASLVVDAEVLYLGRQGGRPPSAPSRPAGA